MSSNHTEHYNLSQWERTDKVLMDDFNADNAKIDAALKAEADARAAGDAALRAALNAKGNCQIWVSTFTGNGLFGKDHPSSITFPRVPAVAFIISTYTLAFFPGQASAAASTGLLTISWDGPTVSWYSIKGTLEQLSSGNPYPVIALFPA